MRQTKFTLAILTAVAVLAGCGGSSNNAGDQTPKFKYSAQITFGDSLADVGTYAVGSVKNLGGGKYTINGDNTAINPALTGKNWTELLASQLRLPAPCAAQTGLVGEVAVENHPGCFGYAQGGSRVTEKAGPGHDSSGHMTVPVATQIQNHLAAVGGKFKGDELVTVTVGGNDVAMQLDALTVGATKTGQGKFASTLVGLLASGATNPATAAQAIGMAMATESARPGHTDETVVGAAVGAAAVQPGNSSVASAAVYGPMVVTAKAAGVAAASDYAKTNGPAAVVAMAKAGDELAALVKTQIIANGASRVIVNNLGDFAGAPVGKAQSASAQELIAAMVSVYNGHIQAGLAGESKVLLIDFYYLSHDQITNPAPYGLTTALLSACGPNAQDGSALGCTGKNLNAGDVSHYMFADDRHPTPYGYWLFARYVAEQMVVKGWM